MVDENTDPQRQQSSDASNGQNDDKSKVKKPTRRSNYWKKKRNNNNSQGSNNQAPRKSNFKGSISEMNGHTFECHGESYSASQFTRTMQELQGYCARTYKYGDDICYLVRHLKEFNMAAQMPRKPIKKEMKDDDGKEVKMICPTEKLIWEKEVDEYVKRKSLYKQNKAALFMVIWQQCSEAMQAKLKSIDDWDDIEEESDCLKLLQSIKNIAYKFEAQGRYMFLALLDAQATFYCFTQGRNMTNSQYLTRFKDLANIIEHYGGSIGEDPVLVRDELRREKVFDPNSLSAGDSNYDAKMKAARERFLAVAFLKGADKHRFSKLLTDLENQYTRGTNQFPSDLTSAYNLLVNYKGGRDKRNSSNPGHNRHNNSDSEDNKDDEKSTKEKEGVIFLQDAQGKKIECDVCGGNHYANSEQCPENKTKGAKKQGYYKSSFNVVDAIIFLTSTWNVAPLDDSIHITLLEDVGIANDMFHTIMTTYILTQGPRLHRSWILLDNQSNVDIFANEDYLIDIGPAPVPIRSYSNGGSQLTDEQGTLPGYGPVWFNPESIANILSFSNVEDKYRITYTKGNFRVHLSETAYLDFQRVENNLFVYKPSASATDKDVFIFIQTVAGNRAQFSDEDIEKANKARRLYICMGRPSHRTFKYMLNHSIIKNANVTAADAERAVALYGPDIGSIRGKKVRQASKAIKIPAFVPLPSQIQLLHSELTLCTDFFYVDRLPFLLSYSRVIQFLMVEQTEDRTKTTLMNYFTTVLQIYHGRGFKVNFVLGDGEFDCLTEFFQRNHVVFNTTAADEHVRDIERQICIIKERIRGHLSVSPFRIVPLSMKKQLVLGTIKAINYTVRRSGVSPTLSPMTIVMGRELDAQRLCRLPFGAYCEIDEHDTPRNSTELFCSAEAIALRPMDNFQGGYYFLRCDNWRVVKRWGWTELPMPSHIISSVHSRARTKQSLRHHSTDFTFLRSDRSVITSMLEDDSNLLLDLDPPEDPGADTPAPPFVPPFVGPTPAPPVPGPPIPMPAPGAPVGNVHGTPPHSENQGADPGVNPENQGATPAEAPNNAINTQAPSNIPTAVPTIDPTTGTIPQPSDDHNSNNDDDGVSTASSPSLSSDLSYDESPNNSTEVADSLAAVTGDASDLNVRRDPTAKDTIVGEEVTEENILEHEPDPERPGTERYNLRRRLPQFLEDEYVNLVQCMEPNSPQQLSFIDYNGRYSFAFTQMSAAEGLKRYGDKAAEALVKEWQQLHDLEVFEGYEFNKLTTAQRASALRLVQLIKEKRCGKIKGHTCADGRKQRDTVDSADSTSPTVAIEALLLTLVIDAHEERHVATCDISGAFLKSEIDEETFVVVDGAQVEMLIRSDPSYKKYVHTTKNGRKVVYLKLLKALYGTVKAARLFWENLTDKLVKYGFKVNRYDQCVANMDIDGSQCTICWHVDDLKISHKKKHVVENVISYLEGIFGKMNVNYGNEHTYVGMDLIFPGDGSVQVDTAAYAREAIDEFPDAITHASTPATNSLFDINEQCAKLPEASRELFHKLVAKLLFVTTRGRPDIFLPIAFLTSRVSKADTDDWKKLKRVLAYLNSTIDLRLTLSADSLNVMKWWVDASFAVRDDFKSQTGSGMSMGRGMLMNKSAKQKLVTKSSTEAELVGASDTVAQMVWTKYFLEEQGYNIDKSVLYQDNKSAILLEKNGKLSSSSRTRHVNIRYFFIRDRISAKELTVEYCSTDHMLADFHTKPLQGAKFVQFRDMILGITRIQFDE